MTVARMIQVQYVPPRNERNSATVTSGCHRRSLIRSSHASSMSWIHARVVVFQISRNTTAASPSSSAAQAIDRRGSASIDPTGDRLDCPRRGGTRPGILMLHAARDRRIAPEPDEQRVQEPGDDQTDADPTDDVERVVRADVDPGDAVQRDEHPRHPLPPTREDRGQEAGDRGDDHRVARHEAEPVGRDVAAHR